MEENYNEGEEYGMDELGGEEDNFSGEYDIPEAYGGAEEKPLGGLYALFDSVLNRPLSTKVSNLHKLEIGELGITMRETQRIALLAHTFRHPVFAKFFLEQGNIISNTAMSKDGWFTELFISSKKSATRNTTSAMNLPQNQNEKSWKLIGKNKR